MLDLAKVRAALPTRPVQWFDSTDSTMSAAAGLPVGTIVGAEEQTAGIGRHGHNWHSETEAGLYVSLVLEAGLQTNTPVLMLALGLAVRQAIAHLTDLRPDLRWPNDVILREKKCAGILATQTAGAIVAGIGINVNHREFPPEIAATAVSLKQCGVQVDREDLLIELVRSIDEYEGMLRRSGPEAICDEFLRVSSYAFGKNVQVDLDGRTLKGITQGLDGAGFLLVKDDAGVVTTILAGGVRPV
jgi:BirA family biotin operon repressor/biotin-[acetyl-CoA-carboxylase] ligase